MRRPGDDRPLVRAGQGRRANAASSTSFIHNRVRCISSRMAPTSGSTGRNETPLFACRVAVSQIVVTLRSRRMPSLSASISSNDKWQCWKACRVNIKSKHGFKQIQTRARRRERADLTHYHHARTAGDIRARRRGRVRLCTSRGQASTSIRYRRCTLESRRQVDINGFPFPTAPWDVSNRGAPF